MNLIFSLFAPVFLALSGDPSAVDTITAHDLKEYVTTLAADDMQGRKAGQPGAQKAARYIAGKFKEFGLAPADHDSYFQKFSFSKTQTENVIGILEGSDAKLKKEVIVIGGHYDHIGVDKKGDVFNGADDDASGTSVMMEIAQAFGTAKEKPKRTIVFIAFGAEEAGLEGSDYYAKHPVRPIDKTVLMINLEMMGRGDPGRITVMRFKNLTTAVRSALDDAAQSSGLKLEDGQDEHLNDGDQYAFHAAGVPILCLYGGENHPDYHMPTDTADKIQPEWMESVARTVFLTVQRSANETNAIR